MKSFDVSLKAARTALWLFLAFLTASLAFGQESAGSIVGVVTDATGAAIPEAKVEVSGPRLPRGLEANSDNNGNYTFANVPVGVYTVTVTKTGFQTVRQQNVDVGLGSRVSYNPRLAVGQVSEVVEVADVATTLDVTSSRNATTIDTKAISTLPTTSRTFNSLLALAPGVRPEVKGGSSGVGGFSVDGASGSENTFYLDGVEVSDVRRGSLRAQNAIPLEFVQELNVRSGGYEAEFGGATGGVINVATRGGTNEFHGQLWGQYTSSGLNARDRAYYQRAPANANLADFFHPKEDTYSIWYPGGILSGPIVSNRLFFTSGYSPEVESSRRTIDYASGTRNFYQDRLRHYAINRLDWNVSDKLQVNGTYIWSPFRRTGQLPNRDARIAAPSNDLSIQGEFIPAQTVSAGATYAATSRLILSFRYGYRYINDKASNYGLAGDPYISYQTSATTLAGVPSEFQRGTGYINISNNFQTLRDITTRQNYYADLSYIANIGGQQHTFKTGYAQNRLGNDVASDYPNGFFQMFWGDAFNRGSITNQRGTYGYYIWQDGVRQNSAVSSRNQGFYVQDAWRVSQRLTLNLGVRFENEFLPPYRKEEAGQAVANPISFGWGSKIAPRIGAAWDVMGDGKWKLSGSFNIFYDQMKYELARGSFGGDIWISNVYRLDNPNLNLLSKANPGALGSYIIDYNNRTIDVENGVVQGIDPDIKPYKQREYTFALDRQITSSLTGSVRYIRKDLLHALEDIGVLNGDDEEYLIGNPGFGRTRAANDPLARKTPNGQEFLVPEAKRQYDAVEFRLQGRWRNTVLVPSYTWSRLYGNYSGLANSDESGRSDPGVSRAYDLPYYYFDASGSQQTVEGRLGTDRPHTFKFFGSHDVNTRAGITTIGLTQLAFSGTPDTTTVIYQAAPTTPYGRNDLGRTPVYTQTDLNIAHTFKFTEKLSLRLEGIARNLFNQGVPIQRVTQLNRAGALTISEAQFFAGYDPRAFVTPTSTTTPYNPIYGLPAADYRNGGGFLVPGATSGSSAFAATNPNFGGYQDFRTFRLGARIIF